MNKAVTLTSGKISINNDTKFGWFVAAGRLSSYKKGGSLSIDPIPDQFKAIYTQHSETHIWVKTGATALATLEVDGVSYPLRSTHIEKSTPTYWGDLNYNRYETLYPHPPKFTEVGQTKQIRIFDADGNTLLRDGLVHEVEVSVPEVEESVPEVEESVPEVAIVEDDSITEAKLSYGVRAKFTDLEEDVALIKKQLNEKGSKKAVIIAVIISAAIVFLVLSK